MEIRPSFTAPAEVILDPVASRIIRGLMLRLRALEIGDQNPQVFAHWLPVKSDDEANVTLIIGRADPEHGWFEPLPESVYIIEVRRTG